MQSDAAVNAVYKALRSPWEGRSNIAIGIDIGTTQSGVAFAYLSQGAEKTVYRVVAWPGQNAQNYQQGKIPTLVWYDTDNKAVSFGAEALSDQAEEEAEDNGWRLAKHFKLHLYPSDLRTKHGLALDPLPANVPLGQIYADFLRYLLQHTQKFFEERILDGKNIWEIYKPTMDIIIAHPNGWGLREQAFLRKAALSAGIADTGGADRICFVSEAEASVHFCTYYTSLGSLLKPGDNFAVCDAGGSTVDTTIYTVKQVQPSLRLEEMCASGCVQAGAIFVDKYAEIYLQKELRRAGILDADDLREYVNRGVKDFENNAKRTFRDASTDQSIQIAGTRFNNATARVRRGRMILPGTTVESFFERCTKEIISSVNTQLVPASASVSFIMLVGGFGESLYLREQLKAQFSPGCQIIATSEATSKAVADGSLMWHCVNSVISRASRYSFGVEVVAPLIDNWVHVAGAWSQIVAKGVTLDHDSVSRQSYHREYQIPNPELPPVNQDIYSYAFEGAPKWMRNHVGVLNPGFRKFCSITADISGLRGALRPEMGADGVGYWSLTFSVCIRFARLNLEAFLEWSEDGIVRTGPVHIVPIL